MMKIKPEVEYKFQEGLPEYNEVKVAFLKLDELNTYRTLSLEDVKQELGTDTLLPLDTSELRRLNG